MSVIASAAVLGLAWFAAVNAAVSLLCWRASRLVGNSVRGDVRRSRALVFLRFLPATIAAIVSCALFVPAHVRLEPVDANEQYGVFLIALSGLALLLLIRSSWRTVRLVWASMRLAMSTRARTDASHGIVLVDFPMLDGIALAGVLRPRLLIGARARQALSAAELEVAIAHELAHRRVGDNLTRVLMHVAPDFFGLTSEAVRVERLWGAEAECLADARAVSGRRDRARNLASALIKVARLGRAERPLSPAWSLFHEPALLETRIRRLVECPPAVKRPRTLEQACIVCGVVIAAAWAAGIPRHLHVLSEIVLSRFP